MGLGSILGIAGAGALSNLFGGSNKTTVEQQADPAQQQMFYRLLGREKQMWPVIAELLKRLPGFADMVYRTAITEPTQVHSSVMGNLMGGGYSPPAINNGVGNYLGNMWREASMPQSAPASAMPQSAPPTQQLNLRDIIMQRMQGDTFGNVWRDLMTTRK